jgi:tetratricopeptide (TPR) repeat protein
MRDSARLRRIFLFSCCFVLTFHFLSRTNCFLALVGSQQITDNSNVNEVSGSVSEAIRYAEAGKWERAASLLRSFVKSHAEEERAWLWLGYSEFNLHQFAAATYAFQQAVRISPQDSKAYYHLGLSFLEMGRPYKAYQAWITTLKFDPHNNIVPYFIGRLMVDAGRLTEAEAWLKQVDASSPVNFRATYYLAFCNEKLGRSNEAIKLYKQSLQQSIRENKNFSAAYTRLAKVLMRMKMKTEARKVLQEGVDHAPDGDLLTTYGEFFIQQQEYDKAIPILAQASQMDPSLPDPHYVLGRLLTKLGQTSKAQQEFGTYRELKARQLSAWEERHLFQALQFDKYAAMTGPEKADPSDAR